MILHYGFIAHDPLLPLITSSPVRHYKYNKWTKSERKFIEFGL
jgi:hypothetical protein